MKFTEINLIKPIQKALVKTGYVTATPIQAKSIPIILEGKDLFGIAQTGTGKTAAFTLPILQLIYNNKKDSDKPKCLILAPTRELAAQIGESIKNYGSLTNLRYTVIFGGVKQFSQERDLANGVEIIIATPGRLLDLLEQGLVKLKEIEYLILDEADRMLDMGFISDIRKIVDKLPRNRQTLFFSATMSKPIEKLAKEFLNNPQKVQISPESTTVDKIEQGVFFIDKNDKDKLLFDQINSKDLKSVLVFTRTKHKSDKIVKYLEKKNISAVAIHGNKSQNQRTEALKGFKTGKIKVLVATEIVARGIDIDSITHVINYEIPNEAESYVHRIGRCARAGKSGIAYSFCSADEREYLRDIVKLIKKDIPVLSHDKHSDFAQNATGKDARPIPKAEFHNKKGGLNKKKKNDGGDKKKSYKFKSKGNPNNKNKKYAKSNSSFKKKNNS